MNQPPGNRAAHSMPRRSFVKTTVAATAGLLMRPVLAADPGDWPSHGRGIDQTRFNPDESVISPQTVSRLELRWQFEAGSGITATPAVIGDTVIVPSWDGKVYALDRLTGRPRWTFDSGLHNYPPDRRLGIFSSPAVWGQRVYIAADRLVALDLNSGKLVWQRTIGNPDTTYEYFWAPPIVHRGRLYAGTSAGSETSTRGRLVSVDAATGTPRWNFYTVARGVAGGALFAAPSIDPETGTLYAATGAPFHAGRGPLQHSCSLIALDAANGSLRWADQVHPHDTHNMDLNCPPMLISAAGRRLIVVGGKDGIRAWDRRTHRRVWHTQLTPSLPPNATEALPTSGPETGPTAAAYDLVFFASNNHQDKGCQVAALEAATGEIRWTHTLPAFQFGPLSVAGGVVFLGLADGKLRAWRAKDGEPLWESPQGQPIAAGPAIARGMVFIGTGAGSYIPGNRLLAFALK